MLRDPAVAGQFYPNEPEALGQIISTLTPQRDSLKDNAIAVISPHAGYIYSGGVAAETFSQINIPDTVVILGPNHHGIGPQMAVMERGIWQMPFGKVTINEQLAKKLIEKEGLFKSNSTAHVAEHSLEVQIPFLQYHNKNISIVPVCLSYASLAQCEQAGKILAQTITEYGKSVLLVASTDMTHYESRESATRKDNMAMQEITDLKPESLFSTVTDNDISMCGFIPTTIALTAALHLGARNARLVRYTDSGEKSGDLEQVVGYAGYVIT